VGYHYYVDVAGQIAQLLPHATKPYAQKTENDRGIAIVLQGAASRATLPEAQNSALFRLVRALAQQYPALTGADLYGHRDWTNRDQAQIRAGTWRLDLSLANDHQDPAPATRWEAGNPPRWGLPALIDATRAAAALPVLDPKPEFQFAGGATYYGAQYQGRRTASGEVYDRAKRTTAIYLRGASPALPFGTWLWVCREDGSKCTTVKVNDTGLFAPPAQYLDLSEQAFRDLAPLATGRLNVSVTVLGVDGQRSDGVAQAFYPCWQAPRGGGWVEGADLVYYRQQGWAKLGCPQEEVPHSEDGGATWDQRFTKGLLRWSAARGVWFEPGG
jgi:rare lipoprotein A (peptidoglycan hydrolase)